MTTAGDNLRFFRTEARMTQQALGQALGHTSGSYISAIENGRKHPSTDVLGKLAAAIGITEDDLCRPRDRRTVTIMTTPLP